jgi:hypothetical protein
MIWETRKAVPACVSASPGLALHRRASSAPLPFGGWKGLGRSIRGAVGVMESKEYVCAVKKGVAESAASTPPTASALAQIPLTLRIITKSGIPPSDAMSAPTTGALAVRVTCD